MPITWQVFGSLHCFEEGSNCVSCVGTHMQGTEMGGGGPVEFCTLDMVKIWLTVTSDGSIYGVWSLSSHFFCPIKRCGCWSVAKIFKFTRRVNFTRGKKKREKE